MGNIAGAAEFVARNARKNHFLAIRRHGVTVPAPVLSGHALAGPGRRPVRTRIECRLYERTGPAWRGISFGQASLVPLRGELLDAGAIRPGPRPGLSRHSTVGLGAVCKGLGGIAGRISLVTVKVPVRGHQ